jgi:hypothetical protein
VLLLISELLLQLHELLFFALLDGIVLVGLLALLKGVSMKGIACQQALITIPELGNVPLASGFWRSSSIAAGHDAGACGESCSGLDCEPGCWADSFGEGLWKHGGCLGWDDVVRSDDLLYLRGFRSGGRLWLDHNSGLILDWMWHDAGGERPERLETLGSKCHVDKHPARCQSEKPHMLITP